MTNENKKDYQIIIDMIKEMEEQINILQKSISNQLYENYNLKDSIIEVVLPYKKELIPSMKIEVIKELFTNHNTSDTVSFDDFTEEELREKFTEVKDMSIMILSAHKEYENIKKDSTKVLDEYVNFLSSQKVKESRENRLKSLKEAIENETNEIQKKKMEKMISTMEASMNYSFIEDRFKEFGEKEINSIMDAYFNDKKGTFVIGKYISKIKNFGYNPDMYKYFFNIEENFLPEEYHPFNNLFLFIYMRLVGYSDPYNSNEKMLIQSLTGAMANLIYHKFDNGDDEDDFLEVIKNILNYFKDKEEYFKENNTTYPLHPIRLEQKKEHDAIRLEALRKKLSELKYPIVIPDDIDVEDLQKIYNDYVDGLVTEQMIRPNDKEDNESEEEKEFNSEEIIEKAKDSISEINESIEKLEN